jgi:hypothetical protein
MSDVRTPGDFENRNGGQGWLKFANQAIGQQALFAAYDLVQGKGTFDAGQINDAAAITVMNSMTPPFFPHASAGTGPNQEIGNTLGAGLMGLGGAGGGLAAEGGQVASGLRTVEQAGISPLDAARIQAVADKIKSPVTVVGSRAAGTARAWSDWDYIVEANAKARSYARWQLPRGLSGGEVNGRGEETGLDLFREALDPARPHVVFHPRK